MQNLIQILKNIGLSEKEAITYCTNLKIGTNPASVIAKHSELNRCTTYSILESLIKKGLVSQFEKNKIRYFTAANPDQLIAYINEKNRDLNYFKEEIINSLSEFEALKHPKQIMPKVKAYSGKSGLIKIFHEILKEEKISILAMPSKTKHEFFTRFALPFIKNNKKLKLIIFQNKNTEKIEISVEQEIYKLNTCSPIEFIGNKRLFIIAKDLSYGIEIIDNEIVNIFKEKFESIWNTK
jgi:sugar-specific transcriptional regulator TrmB